MDFPITEDQFNKWLAGKADGAIIGQRSYARGCPVSESVRQITGTTISFLLDSWYAYETMPGGVDVVTEREKAPEWAQNVAFVVDNYRREEYPSSNVTAQQLRNGLEHHRLLMEQINRVREPLVAA